MNSFKKRPNRRDNGDNDVVMFIELLATAPQNTELRRASKSDDDDNDGYLFIELAANADYNELRRASKRDDGYNGGYNSYNMLIELQANAN